MIQLAARRPAVTVTTSGAVLDRITVGGHAASRTAAVHVPLGGHVRFLDMLASADKFRAEASPEATSWVFTHGTTETRMITGVVNITD